VTATKGAQPAKTTTATPKPKEESANAKK